MDYELYHDESKEDGYWHCCYLVPVHSKNLLVNYLNLIRDSIGYKYRIEFKNIRKKGDIYKCAESYIHVGVASLLSKFNNQPYTIILGLNNNKKKNYEKFNKLIKAKLIVFQERDNLNKMNNFIDYGSKVETTLRMGLKGGIHLLGDSSDPINIIKMHFDGHEHYRRHLDKDRIINRINGLRDYCTFKDYCDIIDDRSSNHRKEGSQTYDDCQILQLVDLLIGSFRFIITKSSDKIYKDLTFPVQKIIERYKEGFARMKNSRWANSFCMSQCYLENYKWNFDTFTFNESNKQSQLFN